MSYPDISLVISAWNASATLRKTLDSILENLVDQRYEIVLVNDGSTDKTGRIARSYARKHAHIRVLEQHNQGLGASRNNALQVAQGRYVWCFDADDLLPKGAFASFDSSLLKQGLDIILFYYDRVDRQAGTIVPVLDGDRGLFESIGPDTFTASQHPEILACSQASWIRMVRRDFIVEKGLAFSNIRMNEDYIYHLAGLIQARSVRIIPNVLYRYCQNHSALSTLKGPERLLLVQVLAECEASLPAFGASQPMVDAFYVAKAHSLLWACCNTSEPHATRLRDYNDAFLRNMPEDAFVRFARHRWLHPDVARYALQLRGVNPKLFSKLAGLYDKLARLFRNRS